MSFWKSLLGLGGQGKERAPDAAPVDYKGFLITPAPYPEGGQYQVAGAIAKEVAGQLREHKFVRADRFGTLEEAREFSLIKARQIIDQQGERIFQ